MSEPERAAAGRDTEREYAGFWALDALFPRRSPCVVTARDGLVVAFTRDELSARMGLFVDPTRSDEEVRRALLTERDRLDLARVRDEVRSTPGTVREVLYRPFDVRVLYEHPSLVERPRPGAFTQRPGRRAFALLARRQSVPGQPAAYVFSCALTPIDGALRSDNRGSEQALFAYDAAGEPTTPASFRDELCARTGAEFSPAGLLAYAYAVLHAPSYRARYGRFHEEGFPRVPAPRDAREFALLATHGAALLALHNTVDLASLVAHWDSGVRWVGDEASLVGPLRHDESSRRLYVGRAGYFSGFTPELAGFRVGSYRPAFKWLRDREGRPLDAATRDAYLGVLAAMNRTRALCEIIDAVVCSREP